MRNGATALDRLHIPPYQWGSEGLHGPLQPCVCTPDNQTCKCPTSFPCPSALGAAFNLDGGAAVLDKLGCLDAFREHNNPMRVVRTRRVGNDALGQIELMNIFIADLIERDEAARARDERGAHGWMLARLHSKRGGSRAD